MKLYKLLLTSLLTFCAVVFAQQPMPVNRELSVNRDLSEQNKPEVVVEKTAKNSEGEKSGIQRGDVLRRWRRGEAGGELESPFDLVVIEMEQAPLGPVTLEGTRDGGSRSWTLGQDTWGIKVGVDLPEELAAGDREANELIKAGKSSEAGQRWQEAAKQISSSSPVWLRAWWLSRAAETFAEQLQWKEADRASQEAVQSAIDGPDPRTSALLLQAWARTFEQRNDWDQAERCYQQAMGESRKLESNSLMVAASLDALAMISIRRRDLAKAEEYAQQALNIQESISPDSPMLARSLNDLGEAQRLRGNLTKAAENFNRALGIALRMTPQSLELVRSLNGLGVLAFTSGNLAKAEEQLQQALRICAYSESLERASTLNSLGRVARERGDLGKAEEYHLQALGIRQHMAPESLDVAFSLNNLGIVAVDRGDLGKAEEYYQHVLRILQRLVPESLDVAGSLNNLGILAKERGDTEKAEEYYQQALRIRQRLAPESLDVAGSLNNLGVLAQERGDLGKAEGYYQQALRIRRHMVPESLDVAGSLNNLGFLAQERGDLEKAEEYLQQALKIQQHLDPGSLHIAISFDNLGDVSKQRGDWKRAEEYYQRALRIRQQIAPESTAAAASLINLGAMQAKLADLGKAEASCQQAMRILRGLAPVSRPMAQSLSCLGNVKQRGGDLAAAEEYYRQTLEIQQQVTPESINIGRTLNDLGNIARTRGRLTQAEAYYRQALAILKKQASGTAEEAKSLESLASMLRSEGQVEAAVQLFSQAMAAMESQIARLGGSNEERSEYRATNLDFYRDYIDLLFAQNKWTEALEVLERSRAQTLREMLASAHVDIRKGVEPALLERERSLAGDIRAKSNRRIQLRSQEHKEALVAAMDQEIDRLLQEHKDVEEQIRISSPAYAGLIQPLPLHTKEIQQLLDSDTVLLEYSLAQERSLVFIVTRDRLSIQPLPARAAIEQVARDFYQGLAERNRRVPGGETQQQRERRLSIADQKCAQLSARLSEMVLRPVAGQLGKNRLLIVSEGALQYIPFAVLPEPNGKSGAYSPEPLMLAHEIVNLPSASVLTILRHEAEARKPAPKAVMVIADPVFDRDDSRLKRAREVGTQQQALAVSMAQRADPDLARGEAGDQLTRSLDDVGWQRGRRSAVHLPRLLFTRKEAEEILAVTPAGEGRKALDFQASLLTATSPDLAQYKIVHFATHGLFDSKRPELSGLVLSMVNEHGDPQEGFLSLQEIYNMNLAAELVVLSACQTGLGKDVRGEGLVGLTRGFMYAGASRVLSSLWSVNDLATSELMAKFYRGLEREGLRPADALRRAQIDLWKQRRWSAPYYWAAFRIEGDWN